MEKIRFGALVRRARERKGLKGFELADLMHTHGSQISRLENGSFKETPSPDLMNQLHHHLGLTHREMLTALGYLPDACEPEEDDPDPLRDRLEWAARQVRWRDKPELAHSLITVVTGILHDQEAASRRGAANSASTH